MRTIGIEVEMPVADKSTGNTHKVGPYFHSLFNRKQARGEQAKLEQLQASPVAVHTPLVVSGVDNAFNNLESAIGPLSGRGHNLNWLHSMVMRELDDVRAVLALENAMIINFSEHPAVHVTSDFYSWMRTPKPIYEYWVGYRGWDHKVGVDAKAHNGPTTGISATNAVPALNAILGFSAAFIALYANSPFEDGKLAGCKENRLTIWPRMFSSSRYACDLKLQQCPEAPFRDLKDYFQWMFGVDTNMQFVVQASQMDYKKPFEMLVIEGDPSLLTFLRGESWKGSILGNGTGPEHTMDVKPCLGHLEFLQFTPFLDARIRYAFKEDEITLQEFLRVFESTKSLEELYEEKTKYCYIEGRAAGANFPDKYLAGHENGDVPRSVIISASALQLGLLQNLSQATRVLGKYDWTDLCGLRTEAIKHGLDGEYKGHHVKSLCKKLVELAGGGLAPEEHWMLTYPEYVLRTGKNGADKAIQTFEQGTGTPQERIRQLTLDRELVLENVAADVAKM